MYDAGGRVINVQLTGSTPDQDIYTYDPNTGRMHTFEFEVGNKPKNLTGTLTWNANGTLAELQIVDGFNPGGSQTCYSNSQALPLKYGYDDWGRLVEFDCGSGNWGQQFSYGIYDNLTTTVISGRTGTPWTPGYNLYNNHCIGCTYDANGDVTGDGGNDYSWNEFSKLASTAASPGTANCGSSGRCAVYDAFGHIVEQSFGATWRQQWITQLGFTAMMTGTSPNYAYWPVPGNGKAIIGGNGTGYGYLHPDWLGNARITSDLTGNTIDVDQAYAPYGEVYNTFGSTSGQYEEFATLAATFAPSTSGGTPIMWDTPNRELSYVGRWLSPDPARAGWNQYAYPTNPNSFTDPTGLDDGCYEGPDAAPCLPDPNDPYSSGSGLLPVSTVDLSTGGWGIGWLGPLGGDEDEEGDGGVNLGPLMPCGFFGLCGAITPIVTTPGNICASPNPPIPCKYPANNRGNNGKTKSPDCQRAQAKVESIKAQINSPHFQEMMSEWKWEMGISLVGGCVVGAAMTEGATTTIGAVAGTVEEPGGGTVAGAAVGAAAGTPMAVGDCAVGAIETASATNLIFLGANLRSVVKGASLEAQLVAAEAEAALACR